MKTEILTTIPKKIKKVDRNTLTAYSSGNPATANSTYMIHFSVTLIRKNYASYLCKLKETHKYCIRQRICCPPKESDGRRENENIPNFRTSDL